MKIAWVGRFQVLTRLFFALLFSSVPVTDASSPESLGPYGGQFECIGASASDPEILYAGTWYGGIWKSTDSGERWNYLGFRGDRVIESIAVDCGDPDRVFCGWRVPNSRTSSSGAARSLDGGLTWEEIFAPVRKVAASPLVRNVVFVGNQNGLYRSTDGGDAFIRIDTSFGYNNILVITPDPIDPAVCYLGTDNAIYKSVDSGDHWVKLRDVFDFMTYPGYVKDISVSGIDNRIVLTATGRDGLLVSEDGGLTWRKRDSGATGAFCDPADRDVIYAAHLSGFEKSEDLGRTFQPLSSGRYTWASMVGGSIWAYDEESGGLLRSGDRGVSWTLANSGACNTEVLSLLHEGEGGLLAITRSGFSGTLIRLKGEAWEIVRGVQTGSRLYSGVEKDRLYMIGGWEDFHKSTDQGNTWDDECTGLPYCVPVDLAVDGDTLYLATVIDFEGLDAGIYRSTDEGDTWSLSSEGLPGYTREHLGISRTGPIDVYSVAIDPSHPWRVYAGSYGHFFRSDNSGGNWKQVFSFDGPEPGVFEAVVPDPDGSGRVFAVVNFWDDEKPNALYRSENDGISFEKIDCPLDRVLCLYFDPDNGSLYAGGESGVVRSTDKGSEWKRVGDPWDRQAVSCLAKRAGSDELYAGTVESGVYRIRLGTGVLGTGRMQPEALLLFQNHPNPFNASTIIRFRLPQAAVVTLDLFDRTGRKIETLMSGSRAAGEHRAVWRPEGLPSGVYLCRLRAGGYSETRKLILQK